MSERKKKEKDWRRKKFSNQLLSSYYHYKYHHESISIFILSIHDNLSTDFQDFLIDSDCIDNHLLKGIVLSFTIEEDQKLYFYLKSWIIKLID